MNALVRAREIKARLWNPPNGIVSDETEIVSEPQLRRRRIEMLIAAEEKQREAETQERWNAIIDRLIAEANKGAAELAAAAESKAETSLTMEMILRVCCGFFRFTRVDLLSARRTAAVVYARHILMYLCREHTTCSLPMIGAKCGGRDHTTVLHAANKIHRLFQNGDERVVSDVTRLQRVLGVNA